MLSKLIAVLRKPYKLTDLVLLASLLLAYSPAYATNFDVGFKAYEAKDYKTALKEFKISAYNGNSADAQYYLGVMYGLGEGVPVDDKQSFMWNALAAEQGDRSAQFLSGSSYSNGVGVDSNYKQAFKWYALAADKGHSRAIENLRGLKNRHYDWDFKDKTAQTRVVRLNRSIFEYITAEVDISNGGDRGLYFRIEYEESHKFQCELPKDEKPSTRVWYFNEQAVKMNVWCTKVPDKEVYSLDFSPKSNKGRNFVVSTFRKASSAVAIKAGSLHFKMSAKGFTKVWNSVSKSAL